MNPSPRHLLLSTTLAITAVALAATGVAAPPAPTPLAQQPLAPPVAPAPPAPPPMAARPRSVFDQLGLSAEQRTRIEQLQKASMAKEQPFMDALHQKQEAFAARIPGDPGYQAAANALATTTANAARAHVLTEAAYRADVYHVLTPAQRNQLTGITAAQTARIQQWRKEQAARTTQPAASAGNPAH